VTTNACIGDVALKAFLIALFLLLAGGGARAEQADCEALKSSYEPFQVIRVIHIDDVLDADHTSVYRNPSGRTVALSTRADGSSTSKTTTYGMLAILREDPSNRAATVKFEYAGVDPQKFPLDQPATYTITHVAANGQSAALKVEYRFIGRKTIALDTCQFDVIRYTSRSVSLANGREVSFVEGEYSPELKLSLNSRTRFKAGSKQMSIVIAARTLLVGTRNFVPAGRGSSQDVPPQMGASQMVATQTAPSPEFSVGSLWKYVQTPVTPGRLFAHGQVDIADTAGARLGGVGFYCAVPHSYIDIFVHRPGGSLADYYWGNATFKTSLELNGARMPATVERGIIYVDISDDLRPLLQKAFELKPGAPARRLSVDIANLGKFDLIAKQATPPAAQPATEVVSFERMMTMCDTTIAAQPRSK
jgi:hypothetical protein